MSGSWFPERELSEGGLSEEGLSEGGMSEEKLPGGWFTESLLLLSLVPTSIILALR